MVYKLLCAGSGAELSPLAKQELRQLGCEGPDLFIAQCTSTDRGPHDLPCSAENDLEVLNDSRVSGGDVTPNKGMQSRNSFNDA